MIVCASSMNRMIGCALFFTSSITLFRRFSNSPFTLAPACSSPMSSTCSATPRNGGGTSSAAMRSARPSTTAVLPTPASPVMIGLFWRRRIRMSIAWRISASRPITGSILPSRARCVRLVVYVSSAGVFDGPVAGAVPSAAGARPPSSVSPWRGSASLDPAMISSNLCFRSVTFTSANCDDIRCANCARSGAVSSASNRCPERMRPSCESSDAISHACSNSAIRCTENTGVRVLPVFRRVSSRSRSARSACGSTRLARSASGRSPAGSSSNARNRCSRSTS